MQLLYEHLTVLINELKHDMSHSFEHSIFGTTGQGHLGLLEKVQKHVSILIKF